MKKTALSLNGNSYSVAVNIDTYKHGELESSIEHTIKVQKLNQTMNLYSPEIIKRADGLQELVRNIVERVEDGTPEEVESGDYRIVYTAA